MIYLYIKQHNYTGLKYFGKTTKEDPYSYTGSGKYWRRHLKKHGDDISTIEVYKFDNITECEKFALNFSKTHNIVESKEWANLQVENGRDGATVGSPGLKGKRNPMYGRTKEKNGFYGKKHTEKNMEKFRSTTRSKNSNARRCKTPLGEFDCMLDAAKAHEVTYDTLRRWFVAKKPGFEKILD